jgi:hypothetical protein
MSKIRRRRTSALPFLLADLTLASWEVIARRSAMMLGQTCTPAEYRRMVREKTAAAMATGRLLALGKTSPAALVAPWHSRATANVTRLRKRGK